MVDTTDTTTAVPTRPATPFPLSSQAPSPSQSRSTSSNITACCHPTHPPSPFFLPLPASPSPLAFPLSNSTYPPFLLPSSHDASTPFLPPAPSQPSSRFRSLRPSLSRATTADEPGYDYGYPLAYQPARHRRGGGAGALGAGDWMDREGDDFAYPPAVWGGDAEGEEEQEEELSERDIDTPSERDVGEGVEPRMAVAVTAVWSQAPGESHTSASDDNAYDDDNADDGDDGAAEPPPSEDGPDPGWANDPAFSRAYRAGFDAGASWGYDDCVEFDRAELRALRADEAGEFGAHHECTRQLPAFFKFDGSHYSPDMESPFRWFLGPWCARGCPHFCRWADEVRAGDRSYSRADAEGTVEYALAVLRVREWVPRGWCPDLDARIEEEGREGGCAEDGAWQEDGASGSDDEDEEEEEEEEEGRYEPWDSDALYEPYKPGGDDDFLVRHHHAEDAAADEASPSLLHPARCYYDTIAAADDEHDAGDSDLEALLRSTRSESFSSSSGDGGGRGESEDGAEDRGGGRHLAAACGGALALVVAVLCVCVLVVGAWAVGRRQGRGEGGGQGL